ncbi:MAG: hypothetical protein Fur0018_04510 [Anaerolineales bacterium]
MELIVVGGLVAAAFVWQRLLPWPVLAFAVFFILTGLAARRWWVPTPLDLPIAILLLMLPVGLWATPLPEVSLPQVWRVLNGVVLYYAVVRWSSTPGRLRLMLYGTLLSGLGIAATAPFSVTWSTSKLGFIPAALYQHFSVLVSDTVHPNVMGGYMALFLPLAVALLLFDWGELRGWQRGGLILSGLIMAGVLILTKSRGAWMGVALALSLLLLLRWRAWGGAAVVLGGGAAAFWVQHAMGWAALWNLLSTSGAVSGIGGREDIWSRAVYMMQDFPFTGVGMGTFGPVADMLYPFFWEKPGSVVHAHNLFLQIGVDVGIPGLIAWLACWLGTAWMGWLLYRGASDGLGRAVGAGVLLAQVVVGVHGFFDAVVWGQIRAAPLLWLVWALPMMALARREERTA